MYLDHSLFYFTKNLYQNAFTHKLRDFNFNHYEIFVVDILHEFKLGVWKAIFTHLMRILHTADGDLLQELNHRCAILMRSFELKFPL